MSTACKLTWPLLKRMTLVTFTKLSSHAWLTAGSIQHAAVSKAAIFNVSVHRI